MPGFRQRLRDQAHRRQDLGDAVVQVAREPLPFFQQRRLGGTLEQARIEDRHAEMLGDDLQADAIELVERAIGFDIEHAEHGFAVQDRNGQFGQRRAHARRRHIARIDRDIIDQLHRCVRARPRP